MKHRVFAAVVLATAASVAAVAQSPKPAATTGTAASAPKDCAGLTALKLPDVKISEAAAVPVATTGAIRAAHCRVNGVVGSEIRFSLLLPDSWNGKFLMGGGGGFVGTVQNQAQASVNDGFATVGTDTGHQGGLTDASWGQNNLERQLNYGYLAVHRTAEAAKAIVRHYYAANESRSYFAGCSNGGRQAMMEAQRYPDDFDGIVAGAPAMDFVGIAAQFIKDIQAVFPDANAKAGTLSPDALKAVEAQVVEKCDAIDGVKDGIIDDPRRCKIDVGALSGLSDVQRASLTKIYSDTPGKEGATYPAQPVGGEGQTAGWPTWITGGAGATTPQGPSLRYGFGTQFFKYFVFNDPSWDFARYDVTNTRKDGALAATYLNATNPDLSAFKKRGGKLIMWHGWADPALTALGSIKYYEQVVARDPATRDYYRFFLMPGVLHCAGGPGPDTVDWNAAITDWVENGKAPDQVIARKAPAAPPAPAASAVPATTARTRPLCPYPQRAEYKGSGSTDDAANFACR
jgi:tannase/feruloyl esterase